MTRRNILKLLNTLDSGLICTPYMPITLKLADILNKGLSNLGFQTIIDKLRMDNMYSPA